MDAVQLPYMCDVLGSIPNTKKKITKGTENYYYQYKIPCKFKEFFMYMKESYVFTNTNN